MSVAVQSPVRRYAAVRSGIPVPLPQLSEIVGELRESLREFLVIDPAASATACIRIPFRPQNHSTLIRVAVWNAGNTALEWTGSVDPLFLHGLIPAEPGDTLVQDGSNTQTGFVLTDEGPSPATAHVPNVLVGRDADGLLLLQAAIPRGRLFDVYSTDYTGGVLAERLARQSSTAPVSVALRGLFSTVPTAAVLAGATFDGVAWDGLPDGVVDDDRPLTGTGTEYLFTTTMTLNPLAGRWIPGPWVIVDASGGTLVQYGASSSGPFHEGRQAADLWRRWRDSSLYWHVEPLVQETGYWRFLASFHWDASASPPVGTYGVTTRALAFPIELAQWRDVSLEWRWGSGEERSVITIPTHALRARPFAATFATGESRVAHFRRGAAGASYDDPDHDTTPPQGNNGHAFQWHLMQPATGAVAGQATLVSVDPVKSTAVGTLTFYAGR